MVDTLPRPAVSAERYRELEIVAMQIMLLLPNQDLGECLIVRDICENMLRRWLAHERLYSHEAVKRALGEAMAEGTNVVRLPVGD